ncbi:MAG: tetratricopeptide repeat protein [Thermoplasmata archaeon]
MTRKFDLAIRLTVEGRHENAVSLFRAVVEDEPQNSSAWSYLGMCLAHLGRGDLAEEALSRAIALRPQNPESWFHLGVARGLRHEWPQAVSAYRRAVALQPNDMVAWHRLGVALAESGDETGAVTAFERALVLSRETGQDPRDRPPHRAVPDRHDEEVSEQEGFAETKTWLDLALSLLSLGEEEAAVAAYDRAYTLDPDRARQSLFRPMLELVTAASGPPTDDSAPPAPRPATPHPNAPRPAEPPRPEVG